MAGFAVQQQRSGGPPGTAPPQRTLRSSDLGDGARGRVATGTLHANPSARPALVAQRALQLELNRRPQVVAQTQLAHALSLRANAPTDTGTASASGAVVQRYF